MFVADVSFTFISGTAEPNKDGKVYPKCNIDQNGEVLAKVGCELEVLKSMVRFKDYVGIIALSEWQGQKNWKIVSVEPVK